MYVNMGVARGGVLGVLGLPQSNPTENSSCCNDVICRTPQSKILATPMYVSSLHFIEREQTSTRLRDKSDAVFRCRLTALCPGLPGSAGTSKVKPIWISLKQETVSGSSITWAICKSAPRSIISYHTSCQKFIESPLLREPIP